MTVEEPEARIIQVGSEDDVSIPWDLNTVFKDVVIGNKVVQMVNLRDAVRIPLIVKTFSQTWSGSVLI